MELWTQTPDMLSHLWTTNQDSRLTLREKIPSAYKAPSNLILLRYLTTSVLRECMCVYWRGHWGMGRLENPAGATALTGEPDSLESYGLWLQGNRSSGKTAPDMAKCLSGYDWCSFRKHCPLPSWVNASFKKIIFKQIYWDTIYVKSTAELHTFKMFNSVQHEFWQIIHLWDNYARAYRAPPSPQTLPYAPFSGHPFIHPCSQTTTDLLLLDYFAFSTFLCKWT